MSFKDSLFHFSGNYVVENDVSIDADGRGIEERIQRSIGEDIDKRIMPYIDSIAANIKDPMTCFSDYVILLLESGGMRDLARAYTGEKLRILLCSMTIYNKNKGTKRCLEALLRLYDSSITEIIITEHLNRFGFDSLDATLDDPIRRFDMGGCNNCAEYSISITSTSLMPLDFAQKFAIIQKYWKPIDLKLRNLTWNSQNVLIENFLNIDDIGLQIDGIDLIIE